MAALLPHEKLSVELQGNVVEVFADGQSTESNYYRDRILKTGREDSVALKYTDLVTAKRLERSAWVKSKNVVYASKSVFPSRNFTYCKYSGFESFIIIA